MQAQKCRIRAYSSLCLTTNVGKTYLQNAINEIKLPITKDINPKRKSVFKSQSNPRKSKVNLKHLILHSKIYIKMDKGVAFYVKIYSLCIDMSSYEILFNQ
jgi:hypothetical protein